MKYQSKITLKNSSANTKILCLEPWAEEFEMLPNMTLEIVINSDNNDDFEIDYSDERITVYAWWNSVAEVLLDGENICGGGQVVLPGPKSEMSLSKTIKWLFGNK